MTPPPPAGPRPACFIHPAERLFCMSRSRFPALITALVLVFFHAPLVVLMVNSFNTSRFGGAWEGGALLAFSLSIDDFVITFFVSGPGTTTLPLRISSMMKTSRNLPVINTLSTFLIGGTFLIAALSYRLSRPVTPASSR